MLYCFAVTLCFQEGLSDECELQSWFVRRVSNMLAERGRRLIGEIDYAFLCVGTHRNSSNGVTARTIAIRPDHSLVDASVALLVGSVMVYSLKN